MSNRKTALIVGASRGLGLGLVDAFLSRGWDVIATVRGAHGRAGPEALGVKGSLTILELDINAAEDVAALSKTLSGRVLDVLFVNAGVAPDPEIAVELVALESFVDTMITNALSPLRIIGALHALVHPEGIVAVMSSNMASINNNGGGGWETYRASKAALNQMLKSFAARHHDDRTYLCMSPGWVRTDMGGASAPLDVETSVRGVVAAMLARQGSGGVHFVDYRDQTVPW